MPFKIAMLISLSYIPEKPDKISKVREVVSGGTELVLSALSFILGHCMSASSF